MMHRWSLMLLAAALAGPGWSQSVSWTNPPLRADAPDAGRDGATLQKQIYRLAPAPGTTGHTAGILRLAGTNRPAAATGKPDVIRAANLIYAGSKSSVCFSGKFLSSLSRESHIETDPAFTPVQLNADAVYEHPFAVMTGEGAFTLQEQERRNLASYLKKGGFLLASAGCSSPEWDRSFRAEFAKVMPGARLKKLPMTHPLFSTLYKIQTIKLKNNGSTQLEALELDGRVALIYSPEGLNDTSSVSGCCCCGGNEVQNSHEINVNIFAYAIMH